MTEFRESIRAAAELILGGGAMQGLATQMGKKEDVQAGQGGEDTGQGGEGKKGGGEEKEYPRRMSSVYAPPTPNVIAIASNGYNGPDGDGNGAGLTDIILTDDEVATGEVLLRHYGVINNIYNYYAAENVQRDSFSMQLDEFRDLINDCEIDPRVKSADIFRQVKMVYIVYIIMVNMICYNGFNNGEVRLLLFRRRVAPF